MTHYFIECFLRTAGYNGAEHGHGATFAARLSNGMLTINHAAGTEEGILSEEAPTLWRVRDELDDFYE